MRDEQETCFAALHGVQASPAGGCPGGRASQAMRHWLVMRHDDVATVHGERRRKKEKDSALAFVLAVPGGQIRAAAR